MPFEHFPTTGVPELFYSLGGFRIFFFLSHSFFDYLSLCFSIKRPQRLTPCEITKLKSKNRKLEIESKNALCALMEKNVNRVIATNHGRIKVVLRRPRRRFFFFLSTSATPTLTGNTRGCNPVRS